MDLDIFADLSAPAFSKVPPPDFTVGRNKPLRIAFPYSQEAHRFALNSSVQLENSWEQYSTTLANLTSQYFLDYFSKRHQRERIADLKGQLAAVSQDEVKKKKIEANPYTMLKEPPSEFKYRGVCRMANLMKLFPELLEKNFALLNYQFLVLGDQGGFSEYIVNQYLNNYFEEPIGYALFPKVLFKVPGVTLCEKGDINFSTISEFSSEIEENNGESPLMLIISDLSWKEEDSNLEEKYMTQYLAYSLYMAAKLLARGGNLIVKLYNTYHPTTIELIYTISSMFSQISLIKPLNSAPHSSCRVLIALDFKGTQSLDVFEDLAKTLESLLSNDKNLDHVLPFSTILSNKNFQDYIMTQNSTIAETQITAMQRILEFLHDDSNKLKINKEEVAQKCLIDWKLLQITEEERKENAFEEFIPNTQPDTVRGIKNERPVDLSGIADIVFRDKSTDIKLKSSARKLPDQIAPERTLDLQKVFKPQASPSIADIRLFRPKGSKKTAKK